MSRDPRKRLGRGLGALLGDDYLTRPGTINGPEVRTIPVGAIAPNPFQPRREFDEDELTELRNSIQENGLLQPLVVRASPDRSDEYELVAGERRLRSITQLGWTEVPSVIREVDDRTLLVLALVENIQRAELSPLEEAEGYRALSDDFELTQGEIAEAVGRSRSAVANALRLLRLPPSVRRMLDRGELSMGHARALLAVDDPGRLSEMARKAVRDGWTVREMETRTRKAGSTGGASSKKRRTGRTDPVHHALQEELRRSLGTRVALDAKRGGKGSIRIPYHDREDFERVFRLLTGREADEVAG